MNQLETKALSLRARVRALTVFIPDQHPRAPAGSSIGGEFVSGRWGERTTSAKSDAQTRTLPGVTPLSVPSLGELRLNAREVTFYGQGGGGVIPKDVNQHGTYWFESVSGSFANPASVATFQIERMSWAAAKQRALQQAGAYGHNQLRVAV